MAGPTVIGGSTSGVRYVVKDVVGGSVEYKISPSASATPGTCDVGVRVTISPVSIESNFAVRDGDAFNFLVGQQADFYVSAGGYQLDQHQWQSGAPHVDIVRMLGSDARETVRDNGQTIQAHPSWFYDGDDYQGQVSCSVRIKAGATIIDTVSLNRVLRVYRPIVDVTGAVGPSTINDPALGSQDGAEEARAGSRVLGTSGAIFVGKMKLPPLFAQAQGSGQWSYVQLASDAYSFTFMSGGGDSKSFPMGLDNVYPYGGRLTSSGAEIDWCDTTYSYELNFLESPTMGIGEFRTVSRSFSGKPFVVLRPPVYSGQGRVDMPIKKAGWSYAMNSSRNASLDWEQTGSYVFNTAMSLYETTPYGTGLSLNSPMQNTMYSEEMDWHTVLRNP